MEDMKLSAGRIEPPPLRPLGPEPVLPIDVEGLRLDPAEARRIGEGLSADYCFAEPFPHIVLDDFLPATLAAGLRLHFPTESLRSDVVFEAGSARVHKRHILPKTADES